MIINKLFYFNQYLDWQLEPLAFDTLNLLVGASGVGKTRILKAITDLKDIALGEALNGVMWEIEFSVNGQAYQWSGAFEILGVSANRTDFYIDDYTTNDDTKKKPKIVTERLMKTEEGGVTPSQVVIVDRKQGDIYFYGSKIPVKLSAFESIVKLFGEDEDIVAIYEGFTNDIIESDTEQRDMYTFIIPELAKQYKTLETIKSNSFNAFTRLALVHENFPELFAEIKESFIDVFPEVMDMVIKFKPDNKMRIKVEPFEEVVATDMVLYVKIAQVDGWISHQYLSAGMIKTLVFITDIYTCPDGTIMLIDEFENSLGVNCINILEDITVQRPGVQYVITSHHPYIINNVPLKYWQIITRQGGRVKAQQAETLNLGKSKHEAFMQLMQLDQFVKGHF